MATKWQKKGGKNPRKRDDKMVIKMATKWLKKDGKMVPKWR